MSSNNIINNNHHRSFQDNLRSKMDNHRSEKNKLRSKMDNLLRRRKKSQKKKNRKKHLRSVITTCQDKIRNKDREFKFLQSNLPIYPEQLVEAIYGKDSSKSDNGTSEGLNDWFIKDQIRFIHKILED